MNHPLNSTLRQLWHLAGGDPNDPDADWNDMFEPVGLILLAPPRKYGYWCTPLNSLTFATTGGDGDHYGLLAVAGEFTEFSPVVMTVPMCDTPNIIVGANLREFLALGCRYGYFGLGGLAHDRSAMLQELEFARYDPESDSGERALLQLITTTFRLKPWTNPGQRLEELHALHFSTLQMPPEAV